MGKLTVKETEELQEAGILKESTVTQMREKGLVSTRRNNKRYLKTADGTLVSPQLYFQGIGKAKYSKRMTELKEEFNSLVGKYSIKTNNK
tara:strand:- start:23510 stop:23779 length:270 start_codon:yes stop_codon:yes gene_type:complete